MRVVTLRRGVEGSPADGVLPFMLINDHVARAMAAERARDLRANGAREADERSSAPRTRTHELADAVAAVGRLRFRGAKRRAATASAE